MRSLPRRLPLALAAGLALTVVLAGGVRALEWTSPTRLTDQRPSELSSLHELAGTPDALHLVHGRLGPKPVDDRLLYQRSTNGGSAWSKERTLFGSSRRQRVLVPNFAVAADDDLVTVAFRTRGDAGTSLWIRRSQDGGRQWQPRQLLAETPLQRGIGVPALVVSGTVVTAAWTNRANGRIVVRRSEDGGRTWSAVRMLGDTGLSIDCDDAVLDGLVGLGTWGATIHLAWSDGNPGACLTDEIRLRTSTDGGRTWGAARTVTTQRTYGWPEMAVLGSHLLLSLQRPDGAFVLVRSKDRGRTFTQRLFRPLGDRALGAADVLLPGGNVAWLVYADIAYDGDDVATSRIRFRASEDRGRTWDVGETVVGQAAKLRQATNLAATRAGTRPVVAFGTGRVDGSTTDIVVVRAK